MSRPVVICWSGGKDSALALHELQHDGAYEVVALLTTVTAGDERISMHGVRRELLAAQAESLGLPLHEVRVPSQPSNAEYEARMAEAWAEFRAAGVRDVAFGDLFLADLREYRERHLAACGMRGVFPLWHRDTRELAETFLRLGFRGVVCCADGDRLDARFVGCPYDEGFLRRLPAEIDPCGERGEFHTFVTAGPIFRRPVPVAVGEVVQRDSFLYCDLISTSPTDDV